MSDLPAVLDANVLVPAALRDTLLHAARAGLYHPHWSMQILTELRRTLLRLPNAGMTSEQVESLLAHMRGAFPDACVEGHEQLIGGMTNDEKDRHVLAAAVAVGAEVIVTANLKDFPPASLEPFNIQVQHPDTFLTGQFDANPGVMPAIVEMQAARLRRPSMPIERVLDSLAINVPTFVGRVRDARRRHS